MRNARLIIALLGTGLLVAIAGCDQYRAELVSKYPWSAPIIGGRPQPSPFQMETGNIRGFVYGEQGPAQPIKLAFVSCGGVSCFAGNPQDQGQNNITPDQEQDDGQTYYDVLHDFGDGKGAVLTERRPRKTPVAPTNPTDPNSVFDSKYIYLRAGEYFLEGVPAGVATVSASYGTTSSAPSEVTVYANTTTDQENMSLDIPQPIVNDDGSTPHVVDWTGLTPETGISLSVSSKSSDSNPPVTTVDVTYDPSPPNATVELRSPPGSGGVTISQISLVYVWSTPNNPTPQQLEVPAYTIPPKVVAAAQQTSYGPPQDITVPVGTATLQTIFQQSGPNNQPGQVVANIEFLDSSGFQVQNEKLQPLQVSVPMRALSTGG